MKEPQQAYMTTGQIARRTGLTLRTLRYYDAIGLLKPTQHDSTAARLYSREDIIRLQRIQTLKYIGLSLSDISQILSQDTLPEQDLKASLRMQKELMRQKMAHMRYVTKAIDEALGMLDGGGQEVGWDELTAMIHTVHTEKDWASSTAAPPGCRRGWPCMTATAPTGPAGTAGSSTGSRSGPG